MHNSRLISPDSLRVEQNFLHEKPLSRYFANYRLSDSLNKHRHGLLKKGNNNIITDLCKYALLHGGCYKKSNMCKYTHFVENVNRYNIMLWLDKLHEFYEGNLPWGKYEKYSPMDIKGFEIWIREKKKYYPYKIDICLHYLFKKNCNKLNCERIHNYKDLHKIKQQLKSNLPLLQISDDHSFGKKNYDYNYNIKQNKIINTQNVLPTYELVMQQKQYERELEYQISNLLLIIENVEPNEYGLKNLYHLKYHISKCISLFK